MKIKITGHHITVTEALETSVHEKLAKVSRHFDKINSMQVKLSLDNHHSASTHKGNKNHKAEVILRASGQEIFVHATADDMYQSIHEVAKKLDRQVRKHKSKIKSHKAVALKNTTFEEPELLAY